MREMWSEKTSRQIVARLVVESDLVLQTPALFGNGGDDDLTDLPLLLDPLSEAQGQWRPLLTGASLAGALRSYLREVEHGYNGAENPHSASVLLFGGSKRRDDGEQSPLIIDDALGRDGTFAITLRDGVAIDPATRTAAAKKKFDLQLWQGGTTFELRFELCLRAYDDEAALQRALATALAGFSNGAITLGARKRRGYGRVRAERWRVKRYDLTRSAALLDWLQNGDASLEQQQVPVTANLTQALGGVTLTPNHSVFKMNAAFQLDGSLLIRSGSGQSYLGPDDVHLHAKHGDGPRDAQGRLLAAPALTGTSLAGALRARALKICRTLDRRNRAKATVDEVWGADMEELKAQRRQGNLNARPYASRLLVSERLVENAVADLVQNRVSIDRFTGGARDTALFNQQPLFGKDDTTVHIELQLMKPADHEIGLLLLLLKDLWTGDLPLGGESNVGRGRLQGRTATLTCARGNVVKHWSLQTQGAQLAVTGDSAAELETFVAAFNRHLQEEVAHV